MPAIFTHIRFGEEVVKTLPPALKTLAQTHTQCFDLGTQGPDLLFYHKPLKKKNNPVGEKGWRLHELPSEGFFLDGAKLLLADKANYDSEGNFAPTSAQAAYLLGFLCHFVLDCSLHPYIDEHSVGGLSHGKIESELDKRHFKNLGKPIRGYNSAKRFFPLDKTLPVAASVLGVEKKNAKTAIKSMRFINGFFSNRCGLVHGFCHTALTLLGIKSFQDMFIHKKDDPRCEALWETLDTKFNDAVITANQVIAEFFGSMESSVEHNALTNEIFRYNYSGIKGE